MLGVEGEELVEHLRAVCLALPEVTEKISHGMPSWFVGRMFASYVGRHHGSEHLALWIAAPAGAQEEMVEAEPDRFFVPPYVGHRGWLGMRLDAELGGPDWDEVREVLTAAYCHVAPQRLAAHLTWT